MRIEKRDGLARAGTIGDLKTPALVDLREKIDLQVELKPPEYVEKLDKELYEKFHFDGEVKTLVLHGLSERERVERIISFRKVSYSPLYLPGVATPQNAIVYVYLGADVLDNLLALRYAYDGIYFTPERNFRLESLKSLPCSCKFCRDAGNFKEMDKYERFEFLANHNTEVLRREVELARNLIFSEELRDVVEARSKIVPETEVMLRFADREYEVFEKQTPVFRKSKLYPTTDSSFRRVEVRRFFERVERIYSPRSKVALLIPCSAKKPYMLSKTHRRLRDKLGSALRGVNEIIISSPFVAPRELELIYPIAFYDTPTTGEWSEEEIEFVAQKLSKLLPRFEKVYAHVHGGYRKVVERASQLSGVDATFVDDLNELRRLLENEEKVDFDLYSEMLRHMSLYQFGVELHAKARGKYPELRFYRNGLACRVDTNYGMIDLYFDFALELFERKVYTVRIDDFDPKGTIFAAGVLEADERIRPNDIVVFYNDTLLGVAQAVMSGREMEVCDQGVAAVVRRKFELPPDVSSREGDDHSKKAD